MRAGNITCILTSFNIDTSVVHGHIGQGDFGKISGDSTANIIAEGILNTPLKIIQGMCFRLFLQRNAKSLQSCNGFVKNEACKYGYVFLLNEIANNHPQIKFEKK